MKGIVMQTGARMHYAIPKIFEAKNILYKFYTDRYYKENSMLIKLIKKFIPSSQTHMTFLRYKVKDVPSYKIHYNLFDGYCFAKTNKIDNIYKRYEYTIKHYSKIARAISKRETKNRNNFKFVYGFDTASVELFEWAKKLGKTTILEQCVAPRLSQMEAYKMIYENESFEDFSKALQLFKVREEKEWELADIIVCPSSFVKQELIKCGVKNSKIHIIPYGYTNEYESYNTRLENIHKKVTNKKCKFLFVGNDLKRKGFNDLIVIFDKLGQSAELRVAGAEGNFMQEKFKDNIIMLGKLNQEKLAEEYKNADVFILPSYLEGSATVVYEAMSWGLPCIVTLQTGSVIEDSVNGKIVDRANLETILSSCNKLINNREYRKSLAISALKASTKYSLELYGERVFKVIKEHLES